MVKTEAKVEIPIHNIDATPPPVSETSPSPAMVEAKETDPIMDELLRQKQRLLEEIEQQQKAYEEEIRKQKESLEQQLAELIEKERKHKEQQELERKERERLAKQEEIKAEIQKLKAAKEETQKKAQQELEAVRRAKEKNATQVEGKEKTKPQKVPISREPTKVPSQWILIMNAIPLSTMHPTKSSHTGEVSYPGKADAEKLWNEILTKHGHQPKKQAASSEAGKAPRGYTKQMVRDFLDRKKAEEKEEQATQVPPPPAPGSK